jgi:diphthine-ammonia ligase
MRLGVLFSGGKDSAYAMHKAMENEKNEIACLVSIMSENPESYMFHTPNIELTKLQAEAIGLPLLQRKTRGEKEKELSDLKDAIKDAKDKYGIEGIVTGAVKSVYQSERIKKICDDVGLDCLNPLWHTDEEKFLESLVSEGFQVIISGVFAYPLDRSWLGRTLDRKMIEELKELSEKYEISPAGEGGEIETTVLDAPFFRKRIEVADSENAWEGDSGRLIIKKVILKSK